MVQKSAVGVTSPALNLVGDERDRRARRVDFELDSGGSGFDMRGAKSLHVLSVELLTTTHG